MDKTTMQKFKTAVEAAGIDTYAYITDTMPTFYYNNTENSITVEDMGDEIVYCFRDNKAFGSGQYFQNSPIMVMGSKFEDIHEVRLGCTYDQAMDFVSSLGLNLTDDQKKLLLSIASSKRPIVPPTGDYTFKELSEEEYEALTAEEKEAYDAALLQWKRAKYGMTKRQISVE
jgi:hypothetical protein